ncbi:zinc finger protein 85-like [Teleopsis dalmanni]|uniref:zinc finger protein 85-like n=1 Tax=Teleopsis dalmanni TaxID=139649 RepID=UPI0018CF0C19|nr:zinc finger protein 85-like [Teleopsis dalmanni]XP_037939543.1 zinc finger protein 85-like [Teleopsis dalmanni]
MDGGTEHNIHSICRICLETLQTENVYDLFLIPGLAKKLVVCTSLSVEPHDGFPKNICGVCYTRLNDLHDFQKLCVDSVQKFQDMVENKAFSTHTFDIMETGPPDVQTISAEDDDRLNFDPLVNHKLEFIDNEEDVFKMIENVDKEAEEVVLNEKTEDTTKRNDKTFFSNDSFSESADDDDDFQPDNADNDNDNDTDSDDDKPLATRLRKKLGKTLRSKLARKRIPRSEKHLHRIIDCHICHKKFKKSERYQEHMKYHNDKLPHQCTVETCLKGFTTANGLRLHVEHCHAETIQTYPCPEEGCGRTFPRTRLLNWHLKKVHKIVKELNEPKCYPCTECEKVFRCPMALKKHMYKHDGKELPFPCNICGKRFVINSALKDHLMRHAGIKNYVCPYCGVGKTTRQEWNTHINTHTQEKQFKCHLCPHASHNKQNLRMHVKIVHEKIKDYACQYCGKTFGKSNACKMHEMTHTGEKRCECKVCGKKFLYAKGLTKHLKTHEKRVLRAIEVYRKRQMEGGLIPTENQPPLPELPVPENHSKETHQKVAEEILKVCAESAASIPKDPRRVERVDISQLAGTAVNPIPSVAVPSWSPQINFMMKEGPHICPDCGQGFNGPGNLKRHHRIVHEGVKDFACRFCHRRFAKAQTLKHHEMTHTGEKPHECNQCGKRFIQYVALKRHMKVHINRPPIIPATVFAAREELELQEREKQEAKRKAAEERAVIAAAAKEQLDVMQQQQEELQKLTKEIFGEKSGNVDNDAMVTDADHMKLDPVDIKEFIVDTGDAQLPITIENPALGDFQIVNTSTMGKRTVGITDP